MMIQFFQLLYCVLAHWTNYGMDFDSLPAQRLEERRRRSNSHALASNEGDVLLAFLHPVTVFLATDLLVAQLSRMVAHELRHFSPVGRVLVYTKLQALAELFT